MVLGELLDVRPPREHPLDLQHIGTVWTLDAQRRCGRFDQDTLTGFANFYVAFREGERGVDADAKFAGYCTLQLWNELVAKPDGVEAFVAWVLALCARNDEALAAEGAVATAAAAADFVTWDSVRDLHRLFNVRQGLGHDLPAFFDLLQRAAEERGLMSLEEQRLDKVVPAATIEDFARQFASGFIAFISELGFPSGGMPLDK
jgi:hypothetical protein